MSWFKVFKMSPKEKKLLTQAPTVRLKDVVTSKNDLPHCIVVSTIDGELTLTYKGSDTLWESTVEGLTKQKGMIFDVVKDETFGVVKAVKEKKDGTKEKVTPVPIKKQEKRKSGCLTNVKPNFDW